MVSRNYWKLLSATSALLFTNLALAQTPVLTVKPPVGVVVKKGATVDVKLNASLNEGFHLNSHTPTEDRASANRAADHGTAIHSAAARATAYAGPEQAVAELCADAADPRGARAYQAAARLGNARSGGIGLGLAWQEEPCAQWPAEVSQDRYTGPWNHRTASPILVIGNTGDPITPYRNSVAMSRDLARARLLTVNGYGHTEDGNPSACATNYEIRYLLTGALPRPRTVCKENATPFP